MRSHSASVMFSSALSFFHVTALILAGPAGHLADHGSHLILQVSGWNTRSGRVDGGVLIDDVIGHNGVNEVAHDHRDWSQATQPIVQGWFLLNLASRHLGGSGLFRFRLGGLAGLARTRHRRA